VWDSDLSTYAVVAVSPFHSPVLSHEPTNPKPTMPHNLNPITENGTVKPFSCIEFWVCGLHERERVCVCKRVRGVEWFSGSILWFNGCMFCDFVGLYVVV